MFSRIWTKKSTDSYSESVKRLKAVMDEADAIVIGAGAGLSTAAGFIYSGERFEKYFGDFIKKYHISDMYSGGFYPFETPEEYWAYWSRYIYINRYLDTENDTYQNLYKLVEGKQVQVLSTNVDHCFQKAGFDEAGLFCTQGDYGLFQCSVPCHQAVYGNEDSVRRMMEAQGYRLEKGGIPCIQEGTVLKMEVPGKLVPHCPVCGKAMTMNLRSDNTFVEDEEWHRAADRYRNFLNKNQKEQILFLELGVGYNTPGIIKYPFWRMTAENPKAVYACVNQGEAYAPKEIADRSICINADIGDVLCQLIGKLNKNPCL